MEKEFLSVLCSTLDNNRPNFRRKASNLDVNAPLALLMPDLTISTFSTLSEIFTFEFKPKYGNLIPNYYVDQNNSDCKKYVCRYCMQQYEKLQTQKIEQLSDYCPLKLFSNNIEIKKSAILSLFATPQNNLKVFKNGKIIYTGCLGDKITSTISVNQLNQSLSLLFSNDNSNYDRNNIELVSDILAEIFLKEPILNKLRKIQEMDKYGIEAVYYLYNKLHGIVPDNENEINHKDELEKLTTIEIKKIIEDYLISMTAKDCSIMVTLYPFIIKNNFNDDNDKFIPSGFQIITTKYGKYIYRIAVVDLDLKYAENIPYYFQLDKRICQSYNQFVKSISKHCVSPS